MAIAVNTRGTPYHNTSNIGAQSIVDGGTPAASKLLVMLSGNAGNANAATARSGYGLTWFDIGQFGWNVARSIDVFAAFSDGASATVPSTTYAASTGRHIVILEVTGVIISADPRNCFREYSPGVFIESSNGSGAQPISWATTVPLNAANRNISLLEHVADEDATAQANWTLVDTGHFNTPNSGLLTEVSNDGARTTSGGGYVTSPVAWGAVNFEILASIPSLVIARRDRLIVPAI